ELGGGGGGGLTLEVEEREERDQITVPNVDGCLATCSLHLLLPLFAHGCSVRQQQLAIGAGACAGRTRPFSVLGSWLPDRPAVRGGPGGGGGGGSACLRSSAVRWCTEWVLFGHMQVLWFLRRSCV
ncbi:unnamed protein product, partial [Ectocarpus sp. 4 AP-2014]